MVPAPLPLFFLSGAAAARASLTFAVVATKEARQELTGLLYTLALKHKGATAHILVDRTTKAHVEGLSPQPALRVQLHQELDALDLSAAAVPAAPAVLSTSCAEQVSLWRGWAQESLATDKASEGWAPSGGQVEALSDLLASCGSHETLHALAAIRHVPWPGRTTLLMAKAVAVHHAFAFSEAGATHGVLLLDADVIVLRTIEIPSPPPLLGVMPQEGAEGENVTSWGSYQAGFVYFGSAAVCSLWFRHMLQWVVRAQRLNIIEVEGDSAALPESAAQVQLLHAAMERKSGTFPTNIGFVDQRPLFAVENCVRRAGGSRKRFPMNFQLMYSFFAKRFNYDELKSFRYHNGTGDIAYRGRPLFTLHIHWTMERLHWACWLLLKVMNLARMYSQLSCVLRQLAGTWLFGEQACLCTNTCRDPQLLRALKRGDLQTQFDFLIGE